MVGRRAARVVAFLGAVTAAVVACGEDRGEAESAEGAPTPEPRRPDGGASVPPESGPIDAGDTVAPAAVRDLAAVAVGHTSIQVSFTAPGNDGSTGRAASYEVRWSESAITDDASFAAAKIVASAPAPLDAGTRQELLLDGLAPEQTVHVALRARDAAGNTSGLSNDATATTKARAVFLVSEVAPANGDAEGGDFVELVVTKGGWAKGIEIRHAASSPSAALHALGAIDVAAGERVVVHVRGLPGPAGAAQEDLANDKTASTEKGATPDAWDVYSAATGLVSTNSLVSVVDGTQTQDAVAYSARATDASAVAMKAFADAYAASAWSWKTAPVDAADDCATLRETVNANGSSTTSPTCGGYPGFLLPGSSIQRNGVVDTNTRADFAVAPQTPGATNAPWCDPEGAQLLLSEVSPAPVDLLELVATRGGALRGFSVRRNPTAAAPNGTEVLAGGSTSPMPAICVAKGDVVVVHLGAAVGTPSESKAKDELPAATTAGNYDAAWDVATTTSSSSLSFGTSSVIAVRAPSGAYVEAAVFTSGTTAASSTFDAALQYVQGLGLWMPADCNGAPCDNTTTPTGRDLAASWNGVGSTPDAASCRRTPGGGPAAASWSVGASSFGAGN